MELRSNLPLYDSYLAIIFTTTCITIHLHTSSISQVTNATAVESSFSLLCDRSHVLKDRYAILAAGPPGLPYTACFWNGKILPQTLRHTLQIPADAERRFSESLITCVPQSLGCFSVRLLTSCAANASSPPGLWTFEISRWDHV